MRRNCVPKLGTKLGPKSGPPDIILTIGVDHYQRERFPSGIATDSFRRKAALWRGNCFAFRLTEGLFLRGQFGGLQGTQVGQKGTSVEFYDLEEILEHNKVDMI